MRTGKPLLLLLLYVLVFLNGCGSANHPESARSRAVLMQLDSILQNSAFYENILVTTIDRYKFSLAGAAGDNERTLELLDRISDSYRAYNTDSCRRYLDLHMKLAEKSGNLNHQYLAKMNLVTLYRNTGMYSLSQELLESLRPEVDSSRMYSYYSAFASLYTAIQTYAPSGDLKDHFSSLNQAYRDSLAAVSHDTSSIRARVFEADRFRYSGYPQDALDILKPYADTLSFESNSMRLLGGCLGECSLMVGNTDDAIYYYALASISDVRLCAKENTSLRNLAVILYDLGDTERANRYMQTCLKDAVYCNATLREIEVARHLPTIISSYQHLIEGKNRNLSILVIILVAFLFVLSALICRLFKQNGKLAQAREMVKSSNNTLLEANRRLEEMVGTLRSVNQEILESNRIKDEYIVQYVNLSSEYIDRMKFYRHSLFKLYQKKGSELSDELRSNDFVEAQLKDFYASFDRTFLRIFPSFLDRFNILLEPDKRVVLRKDGQMPTEIRVFAFIRLGITNSKKIADLLRCSLQTVYNYRSGIKMKQIDPDVDFEKEIMSVGYSQE